MDIILPLLIIIVCLWYIIKSRHDDFLETDPTVVRLKKRLMAVFPELNQVKLMKGDSSYTINKYRVYICTEYDGEKYNDNMLIYVILHELAHVITTEIGHGEMWRANFRKLLDRAIAAGLYDPKIPRVEQYCGI